MQKGSADLFKSVVIISKYNDPSTVFGNSYCLLSFATNLSDSYLHSCFRGEDPVSQGLIDVSDSSMF